LTTLLFLVSIFQLLPYFILREHSYIPVNDTLDVYVPQYSLVSSDFLFCPLDKTVEQIMNGLNRDLLVSDLSMVSILFSLFSAFWAFTVNLLFIKVIAFIGMHLFLKNNFPSFTANQRSIGAFLFSCIPFFPFFGIGIAGQPLLVNALINIHKNKASKWDYLVLVLFPFYSSLVFTNLFLVICIGLVGLYLFLKSKRFPLRLLLATCCFFLLCVLVEYRLIHASRVAGFIPHRVEFDFSAFASGGFAGILKSALRILFTGVFHVETFYSLFILSLLTLYFFRFKNNGSTKIIYSLLLFTVGIALLFGFTHSSYYHFISDRITFLKAFQIDRFYTLFPFLYFLIGIFCAQQISASTYPLKLLGFRILMNVALVVLFVYSYPFKPLFQSFSKKEVIPTYAEYYDVGTMKQIQHAIPFNLKDFRVTGLGIDPGVLQYSGFYTLDAYLNIYPLAYKKKFRPIIEKEIEKSDELKKYFDYWGNRCFVFSSEIGKNLNIPLKKDSVFHDFTINTKPFASLYTGKIYLISTRTISGAKELGLDSMRTFYSANKFRNKLILYQVNTNSKN
ncbi:MAG TPA: DUF6044 family protein, partial [Bacteroidia bacterium]|nr:DUF6044 family protein [Bacteroidia bacterium]